MPGKTPPRDDSEERLKQIERRLRALETAPRAPDTSVEDGSITILDTSNKERAKFGKLGTNRYGLEIFDAEGDVRLLVGRDGSFYGGRAWDGSGEGVNDPLWDTSGNNLRVLKKLTATKTFNGGVQNNAQSIGTHDQSKKPFVIAAIDLAPPSNERVLLPFTTWTTQVVGGVNVMVPSLSFHLKVDATNVFVVGTNNGPTATYDFVAYVVSETVD